MLTLVINESRSEVQTILQNVLGGLRGIIIAQDLPQTFLTRHDLDAVLLSHYVAHEAFGADLLPVIVDNRLGRPVRVRPAQIVSVLENPVGITWSVPPWIIAESPFPAHFGTDLSGQVQIIPDNVPLTPREHMYLVFALVFDSIEQHNRTHSAQQIQRLGSDLAQIYTPSDPADGAEIRGALEGLLQAHVEHTLRHLG